MDQLALMPVTKSKATLLHQLCAVSLAESLDEIKSSAVAGYVLISDVDDARQTITLLCPTGGSLPKNHLILGASSAEGELALTFEGV